MTLWYNGPQTWGSTLWPKSVAHKPILKMHKGEVEMERMLMRTRAMERIIDLVERLGPLEELTLVHTHAPDG